MKLILSRKGVDSSAGGFPSPIFPDGSMQSIAIPDVRAPVTYGDIKSDNDVGRLVHQLSAGKLRRRDRVHLDPDLASWQLDRKPDWRPLFGQCGAAQTHLQSLGVAEGDIFLFFGWFKQVEWKRRRWCFVAGAPDQHVIFGWLQIDSIHLVASVIDQSLLSRLNYHPHFHGSFSGQNTVYEAPRFLDIGGLEACAGGGVFAQYHPIRCLTAVGRSRSIWKLPPWMHPVKRQSVLSYHGDAGRWEKKNNSVELRSAARGQEFVLDLGHYPEGVQWIRELFAA
ncbi:hypothetical protein AB833_14280 [Chromatiales bacterium (ex Bugula neritina AB1)]|nr:hypothetical protein AB833_14280 [Chromatiales bacterium (ex Bugula neritina AB1)]